MRAVICGGSEHLAIGTAWSALDAAQARLGITEIAHDAASGARSVIGEWAAARGVPSTPFQADWTKGRAAEPILNGQMLRQYRPDMVLALPGRNVDDMVRQAQRAGVPIWRLEGRAWHRQPVRQPERIRGELDLGL